MDVSLQKRNCEQKREMDINDVAGVPFNKRCTIRSTEVALSIPKFTLVGGSTEISYEAKSEDTGIL